MESIQRIFVGGLPKKCTAEDLKAKFSQFGEVHSVELSKSVLEEGCCRGFAHLNVNFSLQSWQKCQSIYNGAKWNSTVPMKLEIAKPTFIEKNKEKEAVEEKRRLSRLEKNYRRYRHAKNMTLVDDENVDERRGWKRGRYGRAIAIMTLKMKNGKVITIDPGHYRENLEKLFGSVNPKLVKNLTWSYDAPFESFATEENISRDVSSTLEIDEERTGISQIESDKPAGGMMPFKFPGTSQPKLPNAKVLVKKQPKPQKKAPVFVNLCLNED